MNDFIFDQALTERIYRTMPYAQFIGLRAGYEEEKQQLLFLLPFREMLIGNTMLPALHGGLIGGFMESAAAIFLHYHAGLAELPKIVDFSLDYLRSGKPEDTYAGCILTRQGSRIANLAIKTWQRDPNQPIAIGRAHFLMPER
ncbi:MAG: PaaI family thioesterase [Neisseria sp.]|nr:PaaI family thioesterase [Neisseria sp.]